MIWQVNSGVIGFVACLHCRLSHDICTFDFSPAQHWGDGTAHQMEIIVDCSVIDKDISWNWEAYPEEWVISKNWWKGQVIIENLLYLKGFGILL